MSTISTVLAAILIIVCVASALMDFRKPEKLVAEMKKLKVPVERLPLLGAIKILGAIGVAIGFQKVRLGESCLQPIAALCSRIRSKTFVRIIVS
ncbi:MAG: DoxX family protein [Ilumatobacteraceae bacterium]